MSSLQLHPSNNIQTDFPLFIRVSPDKKVSDFIQIVDHSNNSKYSLKLKLNNQSNLYEAQLSFAIAGDYVVSYEGTKEVIHVGQGGWLPFSVEFPIYMGGAAIIVCFLAYKYLFKRRKRA